MADLLSAMDWVAALLFAGAIGLIALTHREIKIARTLVLLAAGLFLLRWGAWDVISDQPWYIKAAVGAIVGAFIFGALPPSLAWIDEKTKQRGPGDLSSAASPPITQTAPVLPIGTLRYVIAKMEVDVRSELKRAAGKIEVELHNDSNRLIKFHATTAGNIGVPFDFNKVSFDGYVYPDESAFLVSNRISDILSFRVDRQRGLE
jgi:hypothetical protein